MLAQQLESFQLVLNVAAVGNFHQLRGYRCARLRRIKGKVLTVGLEKGRHGCRSVQILQGFEVLVLHSGVDEGLLFVQRPFVYFDRSTESPK